MTAPAKIHPVKSGANPWYEVEIIEGRQNQIRRMFRSLGVLVEKLKRVKIGPVTLGQLEPGAFRLLTAAELQKIKRFWDPNRPATKPAQAIANSPQPAARPTPAAAKPARPAVRRARPATKTTRPTTSSTRPSAKPPRPRGKPKRV
jgi:23S rRNA pseudouridine2605 synthase